jgi:hypothetical protein
VTFFAVGTRLLAFYVLGGLVCSYSGEADVFLL